MKQTHHFDTAAIKALTFDLFGTVLDLKTSLLPAIERFLSTRESSIDAVTLWESWRARQRHEQFMDTLLDLGHGGYLETVRRAIAYTLALHHLPHGPSHVLELMEAWPHLRPFPEVADALEALGRRYRLVVLSNGDPEFLVHLLEHQVEGTPFHKVFSVEEAGAFKPHPSVYRRATAGLGLEVRQCMMISANSFDIVGARACGLRGAFVNRNQLPYDESVYRPDVVVEDFTQLAEVLV